MLFILSPKMENALTMWSRRRVVMISLTTCCLNDLRMMSPHAMRLSRNASSCTPSESAYFVRIFFSTALDA